MCSRLDLGLRGGVALGPSAEMWTSDSLCVRPCDMLGYFRVCMAGEGGIQPSRCARVIWGTLHLGCRVSYSGWP